MAKKNYRAFGKVFTFPFPQRLLSLLPLKSQINLLSNLGAKNILLDNVPACVNSKSHSGYFWETKNL